MTNNKWLSDESLLMTHLGRKDKKCSLGSFWCIWILLSFCCFFTPCSWWWNIICHFGFISFLVLKKMLDRKCKILNRKYRIYYLISLFLKVFPVIFVHLLPFLTTKFWKITKVYFLAWIVLKKGVIDAEHNVRQLFANNVRYTYLCVLFLFGHDEIGVRGGSTFRLIGILSWHIFRSEQFSRDKCNPLVFNENFWVRFLG